MRPAISVQRALFDQFPLVNVVNNKKAIGHGPSRRDAVDGYVIGTQLHGQTACVLVDRRLGHRVDSSIVAAKGAGNRADGDDSALLSRHHARSYGTAAENAGQQVAIKYGPDVGEWDADTVVGTGSASATGAGAAGADVASSVGNQNVDRTEPGLHGVGHALNFRLIGNIAPNRHSVAGSLGSNVSRHLLHRFAFAERPWGVEARTVDRHRRSELAELRGHDAAQSARGAGYPGDFPG